MAVKTVVSTLLMLAVIGGAAYGGYRAYKTLNANKPTTVVNSEDRNTIPSMRHSLFGSESDELVVEEKKGEVPDNKYLSAEAAANVQLPYAVDFYAHFLSSAEETVCRQIYNGIKNFDDIIYITKDVVNSEDICQLIVMCITSSPDVDYIDSNYTVTVDANGYVSAIEVSYNITREDSEVRDFLINKRLDEICAQIDGGWSDFDKFKFVHDLLIKSCIYDETDPDAYTAYGCLVSGRSVCEGYSKALMLICNRLGLPCLPVVGQGLDDSGNALSHIWNKIMLDEKWYNTDITWDDPIFDGSEDYVRYDFFAVTDEVMDLTHIADGNLYFSSPVCDSTDADYFVHSGYYVQSRDDAYEAMRKAVLDNMQTGGDYARIKCADDATFDWCLAWVFGEGTGADDIFTMLKEGNELAPDRNYNTSGYSVINNKGMRTISIRLKNAGG